METALASGATPPREAGAPLAGYAAPRVDLPACTRAELRAWFREGEPEADACERILASAARVRGSIDVALAEGLDALRMGDRLAALGRHLDDYAREVLDLGRRATQELARLGEGLRTRPLLRQALRSGRVRLRAAQTVLPVAVGEREAEWALRAARLTVRELDDAVRRERRGAADAEEPWVKLGARLRPDERVLLDAALELAGESMPGSSRMERLEALAQEFLAECGADVDAGDGRRLGSAFLPMGRGDAARRAALEADTERWCALPAVADCPVPDVRFDGTLTAAEIDARLRELARLRARWEDVIGVCALALEGSGAHKLLGFTSFGHYVAERLSLPERSVEERVALERRVRGSPALAEARRQGLSSERLRLLARLSEKEIASWTPRARALTCIELRRRLEAGRERRMRAQRRIAVPMPRRMAVVVAAAVEAVRRRADRVLSTGKCLAVVAWHFIETWKWLFTRPKSRSRKVRDRDDGYCQAPECSRRGSQSHHVEFRSHGGGDELENQTWVCPFHHLRCIHGGWVRVVGRAPDALTWFLRGEVWAGPRG